MLGPLVAEVPNLDHEAIGALENAILAGLRRSRAALR